MDMYYYREEAKVEMNFQDITMDGSKVYRMAAKDRKKKTRASKMGKRRKQDMQKMERTGKHES